MKLVKMKFVELVTFVTVERETFAKVGCVEFVVDRMEELMIVMSVQYNLANVVMEFFVIIAFNF